MSKYPKMDFVWTFPVFLLATHFTTHPQYGVLLDENILFAAPEVEPGKQCIAVFTDSDLAERFRQLNARGELLTAIPFSPESFLKVLRKSRPTYQHIVIDPNHSTRTGRLCDIAEAISAFDLLFPGRAN